MGKMSVDKYGTEVRELEWLSSLRGFSALLVFISHLELVTFSNLAFLIGRTGVVCFFLITGYLALQARERRNGRQYMFNRFVRIYPTFWLFLLLRFLILGKRDYSLKEYLVNSTLFNEFFGYDCILGASWMLPIQIIFFTGIAIVDVKFFINTQGECIKHNGYQSMGVQAFTMIGAVMTGYMRWRLGLPFPTAFFLLLGIAFLGLYYREYENGNILKQSLLGTWIIFETGLLVSVFFSYKGLLVPYLAAYNMGIITFIIFEKKDIRIDMFKNLGRIGFTFFLGAGIPMIIVNRVIKLEGRGFPISLFEAVIRFVLGIILAVIITRYVETPILKLEKKLEIRLQ